METRISLFDKLTGKRLCFLENAYNISYTLNLNGLHTARFSLPAADPKNRHLVPLNYVEIWDGGQRVELFRILPSVFKKSGLQREITYECEHVIATLLDDVLFGFHSLGNVNVYTPQALRYILDRQTVKRWNLQACDFSYQYLYVWENENLLSALFSVANVFTDEYVWKYDTTNMNSWQVSLKKCDKTQKGELRYKKNMKGITKTVDPGKLTTRLYVLGYGEGDNQLNIKSVNGGMAYLDADTQGKHGIISKIAVDRRFQDKNLLLEYGRNLLNELKNPYYSYEIDAAPIGAGGSVGDTFRVIDDEEGISELMKVTSISKTDISSKPEIKYTVANKPQDIADEIAKLADRQRIADLYSQGATNIDSRSFQDNADASHPAVLRFYLPKELVRINKLVLNFKLSGFRGYTRGSSAGGQASSTTSGGGGMAMTTSAGGGSQSTTSSGGGSYSSTSQDNTANYWLVGTQYSSGDVMSLSGEPRHSHGLVQHNHAHGHQINMPAHSHSVSVPNHSHYADIPAHVHSFSIPQHTHDTTYGIYLGTRATSATLRVDGANIGSAAENTDIDLVNYLSKDSLGRITRGAWHTVEIIPNALTRVEADITSQIYVNSYGGGDF